ncbi:MFS transporter [Sphingomonas sp.]|uniref:MFS transporter n=1 Tax=Sphingomonas sp. TaxID=28214 RepID=UPI001DBCDC43|nr:MFS transporter [Sphingomonas sp.]MBX9797388.1 MFS transporter [Sphingomonas sp.]
MTQGDGAGFTPPWLFMLCSTKGLQLGVVTVAFPYVAARQGLSIAAIGSVIGLAAFAATVKIIATPLVDLAGSMRGWVAGGALATAILTAALLLVPVRPESTVLIAAIAFAGALAAEIGTIAIYGLIALTVDPRRLGAAASYLQGGFLVCQGLGGGFALWSLTHWGAGVTAAIIGLIELLPAVAMLGMAEPHRQHLSQSLGGRLAAIGGDLIDLARHVRSRYVLIMFATPIGAGGASYLWSGVASEWGASADLVSLVTGTGAAISSAVAALLYGAVADRFDRIDSYLVAGALLVGGALFVLLMPRTPWAFAVTTTTYAFLIGFAYTAFAALQCEAIGTGTAASKGAVLSAIGNLSVAYMPALLGLLHDRGSTTIMLWGEIVLTSAFIIGFALFRPRRRAPTLPAERGTQTEATG